ECLSCHYSAHPPTYTLSLHDALPICNALCILFPVLGKGLGRQIVQWAACVADGFGKRRVGSELIQTGLQCFRDLGWRVGRYKNRSEEHTSELQSRENIVCRLLLEKKK